MKKRILKKEIKIKKKVKDPGERNGKERMLAGRKERERKFINTCLR